MDDVWFAPGYTRRDLDVFLAALSLHGQAQPPLLAVAGNDDETSDLVVASRTLFSLFRAHDEKALAQRLVEGRDPGARRLATLAQSLTLQGAPRLERLRFSIGPASEIMTFLCRRILMENGRPMFIAAALGVRPGLIPEARSPDGPRNAPAPILLSGAPVPPPTPSGGPVSAMNVQAIQATLRTRWPTSRTVRFLWQTDSAGICTGVTPPLSDVVGIANADIVGRSMADVAPILDPSGRLTEALASQSTWSGLDVNWPISDSPAAVSVALGAIPVQDRDRGFDGYRGYGVVHLDKIVSRDIVRFPTPTSPSSPAVPSASAAPSEPSANVVPFPVLSKVLSVEDQATFDTLRTELRDQAGLNEAELPPLVKEEPPVAASATAQASSRDADVARNALGVFDRLTTGILVCRDNIPIFANRHLLDQLGFADEDALHDAGGMAHMFGGLGSNASGSEAVALRARDGSILPVQVRMQTVEWDGLPATMLTVHPQPAPAETTIAPLPVASVPDTASVPEPQAQDDNEVRELRAILETATDGVAVIDAQCNVVSLNRSGEALFGCERGDVIGKPFLDLFAADNQGLASDYLEGLKSNATKSLLNDGREIDIKARNGATIPVFMTLGRLDASGGTLPMKSEARFCALFRDLTHGKKVERELADAKDSAERASALKTDFLAKVSHEIRTPLNAIIGFAEVIMDERFGPIGNARYKDYLGDIHSSGTHVMSLVNDLLDLSKIEAGKMELASDAVDVNKIVNECVSLMQPQASRERVILRLSLAPNLPQIKADQRSLRQIALNLLSNAVKYNEPGGQVIVATTTTDSGNVVIRIRDTGPGMSDDDIKLALEPFRQLSLSRPSSEGTGLGLPLTKALVEANQASLTIKSKVAHGTLVEVAFPAARVLAS